MSILVLYLVSIGAGTLVSTQCLIPMMADKLGKSDFLTYSSHQIRFSCLTALEIPTWCATLVWECQVEVQAHWWAHSTQCLCYHTSQVNPTFLPTALSKSDFRVRLP